MAPSSTAEPSKRKRVAKFLRRGFLSFDRARDAISSSPGSSALPEPNKTSGSSSLPVSKIASVSSGLNVSSNATHRPNDSPDPSALPESNNLQNAFAHHLGTAVPVSSHISAADMVGIAWNGFKTGLQVLEKSTDLFPPLKLAVSGLIACIDVVETAQGNRDDYKELLDEFKTMEDTLSRVSALISEERAGSVVYILQQVSDIGADFRSIEAEATHISGQQAHGKARRIIESPQDKEDVLKRYRRIESLFRRLQNDIGFRTWDITRKHYEMTLLQGMPSVKQAVYDSNYSTTIKRRACTPETREKIQQDLKDWGRDLNGTKVYWMNGMAGTGKTTILYSLCKWLEETQRLGGNFFCSRILDSCRNMNNILPTLAYQLARYSSAFRIALCKVLEQDPDACTRDITRQFEKLILVPMKEAENAMPEGVIIVIDALDECDDSSLVRSFLELMLEHAEHLPIKFLVTSRPEPAVRNKMLAPGLKSTFLHLHDIEESIVEADIKKYLTEELCAMRPTPSSDQVERLAKRAGKLFIYAATAVRYIHPDAISVSSSDRLKKVLKTASSSASGKQHEELDILYTSILSAAFNDKLEDHEMNGIRLVLRTVICAKEPMTVQTLASLLGLEQERVQFSLEPLRSVLHVQEGGGPVSALHASFPDYMFDSLRSNSEFYCDRNKHSEILASGCFDLMKLQLRFNICHLKSSFVFDKDIADLDERVKENISRGLSYTCRYWGEHLREGKFTDVLHEKLVDFLTYQLLFWMEVLNLEGRIAMGGEILRQAQGWLEASKQIQIIWS